MQKGVDKMRIYGIKPEENEMADIMMSAYVKLAKQKIQLLYVYLQVCIRMRFLWRDIVKA